MRIACKHLRECAVPVRIKWQINWFVLEHGGPMFTRVSIANGCLPRFQTCWPAWPTSNTITYIELCQAPPFCPPFVLNECFRKRIKISRPFVDNYQKTMFAISRRIDLNRNIFYFEDNMENICTCIYIYYSEIYYN